MSTAGADDPPPSFESVQDDPYVILGVEATATDDEIKSAYKKLCLKWHPDKNQGDSDAEVMFQKVQSAWGILSSPELRAKYDAGGMDALEGNALNENGIQVDISQTGFMGSTLLAMFRKLGHPIKTVVSPSVLDAVKSPSALQTSPLEWGEQATGRVGNGQAVFYVLDVSPEHLEQGFVVVASCVHARVKLLLWDLNSDGDWSLAAQEDAVKVGQANATALYATTAELLEGVPRSVQAHVQAATMVDRTQQDPFAHIFRVLDAAKVKDRLTLKPGQHLLAVYGDNFFKKSQFTLTATLLVEGTARDDVAATEREIIDKRAELLAFEREFKRTRQEFESAVSKLETYTQALDALFLKREVEYASLLSLPAPAAAATTSTSGALPEDGEAAAADDATSAPLSPGAAGTADAAKSGPLSGGSGTLSGGLAGAGGSNSSFVTEQAKNIRQAASQASTQISGAFRGLFSKTNQRKTDPGWSSADTPPPPEAVPVAEEGPETAPTPSSSTTSRARSFFRAFSRTSQAGTSSPELQPDPAGSGGAALGTADSAEPQAGGVIVQPLPGVAEAAAETPTATETPTAAAAGPAGADAAGSTEASASLSGALFVSGVPHADDSTPNTPGAPAAVEVPAAEAGAGDEPAAADAVADADAAGEPAAEESLPGVVEDAEPEAPPPAADAPEEPSELAPAAPVEVDSPVAGETADAAPALSAAADAPDAAVKSQESPAEAEAPAAEENIEEAPAAAEEVPPSADTAEAADDAAPSPASPKADVSPAAADEVPPSADTAEAADDAAPASASPKAAVSPTAESSTPSAAPAAVTPTAAAGSAEDSFADAPEAEDSTVSTPEPPAEESSQSSFVRRMQERFSKAAQS